MGVQVKEKRQIDLKKTEEKTVHFFVDESGDPNFYGKGGDIIVGRPGCSQILLLGFVRVQEPQHLRNRLEEVRNEIASDPYFKDIPSVKKTLVAFHAKDDCPEVRMMVYKALAHGRFAAQVVVARKIERDVQNPLQGQQR